MNIVNDEKSQFALRYKQIYDIEPRTPEISRELNKIINHFLKIYEPFLFRKLTGVPKHDRDIIISEFQYQLVYALRKWRGASPVGGYIALCLKAVIRQYLIEKSPVNRQEVKSATSYEMISESIANKEDSIGDEYRQFETDYDEIADMLVEDDEELSSIDR